MNGPAPGEEKRYRLGSYGAGTLWCLSNNINSLQYHPDRHAGAAKEGRCFAMDFPRTGAEGDRHWRLRPISQKKSPAVVGRGSASIHSYSRCRS
jgi:hypothetical protein